MTKKKIVFRESAKHGEVTITAYTENGHTEYCVKHSHPAFETYWTEEPFEAIKHARFLVARY